ncbi:HET-domain-containing protein [Hyaloscypha bicolor E]|uniref:HET-domain-containing protein n=1 Tax=Hyaloscypha bicolor E TaxID=1095630 RepID=A0A2J6SS53_9HELO|nr:HET-domain-containing protein [Hyaloscypha bicolor E]PMD53611.1 HET-domain-containing protein [Hyaloscypha bicolor E]
MASRSTSHLCSRCSSIFSRAETIEYMPTSGPPLQWELPIDKPTYAHYKSRSELQQSAGEKCYICVRILEWMNPIEAEEVSDREPAAEVLDGKPADRDRPVNISYCLTTAAKDSSEKLKEIGIWFIEGDKLLYESLRLIGRFVAIPAQEVDPYISKFRYTVPNNPAIHTDMVVLLRQFIIIRIVKTWLSACRERHKICSWSAKGELPTRLVAVDRTEEKKGLSIRLCHSDSLPRETEYVSLSHCWGKVPFFKLTQDKLQELEQSIPLQQLPMVFQDAIRITYDLGFRYIWIDSLCIIQDSRDDWHKESLAMDRVYLNGVLNLAATGYRNGQEGLLRFTEPREIMPPKIDCVKFNSHSPKYSVFPSFDWTREVTRAPLNERGWVCQEQVMSPRTLHFGRRQMYWECYTASCCESFPSGAPFFNPSSIKMRVVQPIERYSELTKPELYVQWTEFVTEYSTRKLTFDTDKLPAISGIARVFMNLLKDRYVDGLWENDIYRGLLWHATGDITEVSSYRAPSWSWASIDGPVSFLSSLNVQWDTMAQIHEIKSTMRNETTDGEESGGEASGREAPGGYIRITGLLLKLKIDKIPVNAISSMIRLQRRWDLSADDPLNIVFSPYEQIGTRADMMIRHSNPEFRQSKDLVIMPLVHHTYDKEWVAIYGLVLSLQPGRSGYYKKVGVYETSRKTEGGMFWLQNPKPIESRYYQEFYGIAGYTITIL